MVWVPPGRFRMGSDNHYPEEAPAHPVRVDGFWMDSTPTTNAQFARFTKATGYVTVCERQPDLRDYPDADPSLLYPASAVFIAPDAPVGLADAYQWWTLVRDASWRKPQGGDSSIDGLGDHPVVHVAYEDAIAYLEWVGKELPSEAEFEWAARGGLEDSEFAWGDELTPDGRHMANIWQGTFPWQNLAEDGYTGTSPVGTFPPNGYGLYDLIGNVWEWTQDWYQARHGAPALRSCCAPLNPRGGTMERSRDSQQEASGVPRKVMKGGSHLCAPNYCQRYRPAARLAQCVDTSTSHLGFRGVIREEADEP